MSSCLDCQGYGTCTIIVSCECPHCNDCDCSCGMYCSKCKGNGVILFSKTYVCSKCNGTGKK